MVIPIISILVVVILVSLLFWVMGQLGTPQPIRNVIMVIVVVLVVLWLLGEVGWLPAGNIRFR